MQVLEIKRETIQTLEKEKSNLIKENNLLREQLEKEKKRSVGYKVYRAWREIRFYSLVTAIRKRVKSFRRIISFRNIVMAIMVIVLLITSCFALFTIGKNVYDSELHENNKTFENMEEVLNKNNLLIVSDKIKLTSSGVYEIKLVRDDEDSVFFIMTDEEESIIFLQKLDEKKQ